jgi:putative membrane protein
MREKHAKIPEERRAIEYLANERTFLAWLRTSIAVVSLGAVLAKLTPIVHRQAELEGAQPTLSRFNSSLFAGIGLIAFGALLAALAAGHYFRVNRSINRGAVKADRGLVILVTIMVILLAAAMILYMLITTD